MYIFVNEAYTGLHMGTTLISVALVDENGRSFYAEFDDYDRSQVEPWIENDIISKLQYTSGYYSNIDDTIEMCDNRKTIKNRLEEWLKYYDDVIIFVMDVGHYDFILLLDLLFDSPLNAPKHISSAYYEINNDIATYMGMTVHDAFNTDREKIYKDLNEHEPNFNIIKNTTLYDANIIKGIWEGLRI